ncbi:MAG: hypothetical protein NUW37_04160 [Planctomycetes bacterium]|nr:hypothetical protein [Planctomycetota bacterium]
MTPPESNLTAQKSKVVSGAAIAVLLFATALCPKASAEEESEPGIYLEVGEDGVFESWEENETRIMVLMGGVRVHIKFEGSSAPGEDVRDNPFLSDTFIEAENIVLWVPKGASLSLPRQGDAGSELPDVSLYAEQDVRIRNETQSITGSSLFLSVKDASGYIRDVMARIDPGENLRAGVILRAKEMRLSSRSDLGEDGKMRSRTDFEATDASISVSRFDFPSYNLRTGSIKVRQTGKSVYLMLDSSTLEVLEVPVMPLPPISWDVRAPLPIRRLRPGRSSVYGTYLLSRWNLLSPLYLSSDLAEDELLLGIFDPYDDRIDLDLDYRSERGFAGGIDVLSDSLPHFDSGASGSYTRVTYYGLRDRQFDRHNPNVAQGLPPVTYSYRDRMTLYHRTTVSDVFTLDVRYSKQKDAWFLDEFFEDESRYDPFQESFIHLTARPGFGSIQATVQTRTNDFYTRREELPRVKYHFESLPVFMEYALYSQESEYLYSRLRESDLIARDPGYKLPAFMSLQEPPGAFRDPISRFDHTSTLDFPLPLDFIGVTPYASWRYTAWSESEFDKGAMARVQAEAGVRVRFDVWRDFAYESDALDFYYLRHQVTPYATFRERFLSSREPFELIQISEVESAGKLREITLGMENRLITYREIEGERVPREMLFVLIETKLYPKKDRDNSGRIAGPLKAEAVFRPREFLTFTSRAELNTNERRWDNASADARYDISERTYAQVGERILRANERIHTITELGAGYFWFQKWSSEAYAGYDFHRNEYEDWGVRFKRHFKDFIFTVGMQKDAEKGEFEIFFTLEPDIY